MLEGKYAMVEKTKWTIHAIIKLSFTSNFSLKIRNNRQLILNNRNIAHYNKLLFISSSKVRCRKWHNTYCYLKSQLLHQNWIVYWLLCIVYSKTILSLIYTIFWFEANTQIHYIRRTNSNRRITDRSRVQHTHKISSKRGQTQALICLSPLLLEQWIFIFQQFLIERCVENKYLEK
jgi:hypothetical protein